MTIKTPTTTIKNIQKELKISDRKSREIKKLFSEKVALEKKMFDHLQNQHKTLTDAIAHHINKG